MGKHHSLKLRENYYHHFLVGFFVFMVSFLVGAVAASSLAPVSDSSAESKTTSNDKTGFYVTVTNSDDVNLSVDGTPVGQMASAKDTINVKTNAPLGYKLLISASSTDMYSSSDTDKTGNHFSTVTGTLDNPTVLGQNTWGFSLNEVSIPIPDTSSTWVGLTTTGTQIASKNIPTDDIGDNINIYYGINANTTMPTGTYTTTVTYTAFAEGTEDIPLMQDFTLSECANMDMDTTTTLMDKRNGKSYTIVKARDGNCWMADNLSLYSQDEDHPITISDADSNLPANTTITLPVSTNWSGNNYNTMLIHVADGTGQYANKTGEYYGEVYYNWCASLGKSPCAETSGTVNQSICPKGWRLPVNGGTTTDKSYAKLMDVYGITNGAQLLDNSNDAYILGFHKYYGGWAWNHVSEYAQNSYGLFWSSTAYSESTTYALFYNRTRIETQNNDYKDTGYTIRCVMDNPVTIQNVTYMQDVTATICANTPTDATWRLLDKRGYGNGGNDKTTTYGVIKARDGNCWMTDNLNLYNKTISYADSDFTSGTFAIPTSTSFTVTEGTNAAKLYVTNGRVYYDWCAAVAINSTCNTTLSSNNSICPKNWRLPIYGSEAVDKTFRKLVYIYSSTYKIAELPSDLNMKQIYTRYLSGTIGNTGEFFLWLPNASSATTAYSIYGGLTMMPYLGETRGAGESVRCVLR